MTTRAFLSHFQAPKKTANGWQAKCPGHDDRRASLSIAEGDKGIILHCQAGCDTKAIVAALGLKLSDLFTAAPKTQSDRESAKNGAQKRRVVATYDYTDADGQLLFQAVRYEPKGFGQRRPDSKGGWHYNLDGARRVLYQLPEVLKAVAKGVTVFLVEGEKDVEAVRALGLVATCNPMGANKWRDEYSESLRGAHVVILPDNDQPGRDHAEAVAQALTGIAASVKILALPNLPDKGDVSDWLAASGDAESLCVMAENAPTWTPEDSGGVRANAKPDRTTAKAAGYNFTADAKGVVAQGHDEHGNAIGSPVIVASEIHVEAVTRDAQAGNYGRLLRFVDPDGNEKLWAMPSSLRTGDKAAYESYLLDQGADIFNSKLLHTYLGSKPTKRVLVVNRTGWHKKAFVLADECIGSDDGDEIFHQSPEGGNFLMRTAGTLDQWKEHVARLCAGNSRLVFAVSAGFAAPLLAPLGKEGGGFHFRDENSKGKTTLLIAAGSTTGGGGKNGFIRRWRATINGLEATAVSHNDIVLCLDELAEVDPREVGETAYMLANGQAKLRMQKNIALGRSAEWLTLFLSSGEISMATHMATAGKQIRGGMDVRLLDLPADAGVGLGLFEELHGAASAKDFADSLKEAARSYYGTPLRAFLRQLVQESNDDLRSAWQAFQKAFLQTCQADFLDKQAMNPQIGRACDRFALVALAGEMATKAGITGWSEGSATDAALRMFGDWLRARGTGTTDEEAALRQVRLFLEQHSDSRFRRLGGGDERTIINQAGYIERSDDGEIAAWYILPNVFRAEVCKGYDMKQVAKSLHSRGCLRTTHDLRCEKRTPEGRDKFYAITRNITEE